MLRTERLKRSFALEAISTQITTLKDYDRKISDRLAFLSDSAIARTLGVAKNTIEAQTQRAKHLVASVATDRRSICVDIWRLRKR